MSPSAVITGVPVTVYKHQTPKSNAGKLVGAARIEQVHVAFPVIRVIMSEKINRVDEGDISEKLRTCKRLESFLHREPLFCLEVK